MKPTLSRNALIGIAFVASLVMIYFGINYLKGANVLKKKNMYVAVFNDVTFLNVSSPVYLNGFQIGLVNDIQLISEKPVRFGVNINLDPGFRITEGSRLEFGIDLFNSSIVKLIMNTNTDRYLNAGDTIYGSKEASMMDGVMKVMPTADSILMTIDSITTALHTIISNPMWNASIDGIGKTIGELNTSARSLNAIMGTLKTDLPPMTQNMNSVTSNLKSITNEIDSLDIAKTFASVDETINNLKILTRNLNSDNGSIGKLMTDPQMYDSITNTLNMAGRLLEDIRKDPKKYLNVRVRLF